MKKKNGIFLEFAFNPYGNSGYVRRFNGTDPEEKRKQRMKEKKGKVVAATGLEPVTCGL